jgi:hypothetical protein
LEFSTTKDSASLFKDISVFSKTEREKSHEECQKRNIFKKGQICFNTAGYQETHNISVLDLVHYIPSPG